MRPYYTKLSLLQIQEQAPTFSSEELDLLMERLQQELEHDTNLYIKEWEQDYNRSKRTRKWSLM
jgi:hypothetical protein